MSSRLAFICVLLGFVCSGSSLTCTECTGTSLDTCMGSTMSCSSTEVCATIYSEYTDGTEIAEVYQRTCYAKRFCGISGSYQVLQVNYRSSLTCCEKDECTPKNPTIPSFSTKKNGLVCPTCDYNTECSPFQNMECTGDMNKCFTETRHTEGRPDFVVQGCSNDGYCKVGAMHSEGDETIQFTCNKAGLNLLHNLYFVPLAVLSVLSTYYV